MTAKTRSQAPLQLAGRAPAHAIAVRGCRHGIMLYLKHDKFIGRSLELYGEYSEEEVTLFKQVVPDGGTVLDAGANIGAHTLPLARFVGNKGRVVAVEPQQAVFQIMCANMALNEIRNVVALPYALGAAEGTTNLPAIDYSSSGNFGGVSTGAQTGIAVPMRTIDGLELSRLDLIKADVEGAERDVLQGGKRTIQRLKPVLYVEADRKDRTQAILNLLRSFGYRIWIHRPPLFNPKNFFGNATNVFGKIASVNLLAVPGDRTHSIKGLEEIS